MSEEEDYMPDGTSKPDAFGRKMVITIDSGFHYMSSAVASLRAAVIATSLSDVKLSKDNSLISAFHKEKEAMYHRVFQPSPEDTLADVQSQITKAINSSGKRINWIKRIYREKIIGHRLSFNFVFDEIVNKFYIGIHYNPKGGVLEVCTNGRHLGREKRIADMMTKSFEQENIPYSIKFEDTLM